MSKGVFRQDMAQHRAEPYGAMCSMNTLIEISVLSFWRLSPPIMTINQLDSAEYVCVCVCFSLNQ